MSAPFGIHFYSPVDNLEILEDLGQGKYIVAAPKPHPAFDRYVVQATPRLGVIWIKGISPTFSNDAYGIRVRQAQDEINAQLSKRYGQAEMTDFLRTGSIWNEERDWSQAITANERHYFAVWERPVAELPDDIRNIFLGASGFGGDETGVSIEYSSSKSDEADQEVQEMLADLL